MSKKILVTGAAGFLGTNLCHKLLERGDTVIGLDDFSTGFERNLEKSKSYENFSFVKHSIIEPFPDLGNIDEIYNLACPASPPHYQRDPLFTWKSSVFGIAHIMDLAEKTGAKVFHTSTSEVYGDPEIHPQQESYVGHVNPLGPRACYDESKRAAETYMMDHHRHKGSNIRIVRIFNTYGPNMDPNDGRVVSNFICQALEGKPITIYGDGKQTRSFCYVDDLLNGFVALMDHPDDTLLARAVNIGNPGEFTMLELAEKTLAAVGSTSEIIFQDLPADDPKQRRPDITFAKTHLKWAPEIALDEGLKKTIPWFKHALSL